MLPSLPSDAVQVVIAGQMPPPYGGQNINIKRVHDMLAAEKGLCVRHLKFEFTKSWEGVRRFEISKIIELLRVVGRAIKLRMEGPIDMLLYPVGGPHTSPILRDLVLLPVLRLLSRRVVLHFRAAGLREYLELASPGFRRLIRGIYRHCGGEAVVLTTYGRRDPASVGISSIRVIPNAFEDLAGDDFQRTAPPGKTVLSVGHICEDKGTPSLIRAFKSIAARDPEASLVLVGETLAPYTEQDLKKEIAGCGLEDRVIWKGILHGVDLEQAYKEADLFVFSSVAPYESFGMVLIEAMQWSLPLIVTDWRANVSVCGEGFGGVIAGNVEEDLGAALHEALQTAMDRQDCWLEWGRHNRGYFKVHYEISTMKRNYLDLVAPLR
ncbi:glycosyltransferase family 4 protein [Haloferula sargassicola]|uniref:Glycosyl transferase family 1 domain-containing protein n=1 Tax=Haloferula sargassicola TaxID=490096 RepID=A0ABP9UQ13_9BACT